MLKFNIDDNKIEKAKSLAKGIVDDLDYLMNDFSSVSIERTVARFMGVDGVNDSGEPLPNVLIDHLMQNKIMDKGIAFYLVNAMLNKEKTADEIAKMVADKELNLAEVPIGNQELIFNKITQLTEKRLEQIKGERQFREEKIKTYGDAPQPYTYVIVATGNIYEDVTQAVAAARKGASIIAVIRSTAQSLLDYVPYGATTEGYGGTYATQENFRIMRKALDKVGDELNRYIRLTNYASGLCMPEISAMGAMERLDVMLNDALYGILFRDINMKRTLLDQYFSRLINAYAGIIINTGEDNYLTTSDAIEKAYTVTASQLINEQFAFKAGLKEELQGLGHAYEIKPEIENAMLYEIAHAMLARKLFPKACLKYMPPTKHMTGDIFRTHLTNGLFNLVSIMTGQSIQLLGMWTEAIHTPHLQDRYLALQNAKMIFNTAKDLGDEFILNENGFIYKRAEELLEETIDFLQEVKNIGLFSAIEMGKFAEVKRPSDGGKGLEGVFRKSSDYLNPFAEAFKAELGLI
jgi:beta-lysine 5,6-aminomutase alpha subunit